jgi:hypothetical protein
MMDAVQSPARGLSAKQILLATLSLIAGLLVFDFFRYLAYLEQGENLGLVFDLYGFFPFDSPPRGRVLAQLLYAVGIAGGVLCLMCGLTAVSIIHVEAIRGNAFMSPRKAIQFVRSRFRQLLSAVAAIVVFVGFIVVLFAIFGLIARVPLLGDLLFAVFFVIPNFIIALFAVFILFVAIIGIILLPAIAATDRTNESFGVILETFSTIIRHPSRWLGHTIISGGLAKIATFVFAYFSYRAIEFMVFAISIGGGEKIRRLVGAGMSLLPTDSPLFRFFFNIFPGVRWSFDFEKLTGPSGGGIAAHLVALMLFVIFAGIIGYFMSSLAAAQVYTYAGIRKAKDGHDLATEKPLFFEEEHVNAEIQPGKSDAQ